MKIQIMQCKNQRAIMNNEPPAQQYNRYISLIDIISLFNLGSGSQGRH